MKERDINQYLNKDNAILILKKITLFNGLFDNEFKVLLDICQIGFYEIGESIFNENDGAKSLFVILKGKVGFSTESKGVIDVFGKGDVFGEMGVITSNNRVANALSLSDELVVLEILKGDFDLLLGRSPRISYIIMKNMASELAERFININKSNFSVRSIYAPQVKNIAMISTEKQRAIKILPSQEQANNVSHFIITHLKNALIHVANEQHKGENIVMTVEEAAKGFKFEPLKLGLKKYYFDVAQSKDGKTIQKGSETSRVYVFIY